MGTQETKIMWDFNIVNMISLIIFIQPNKCQLLYLKYAQDHETVAHIEYSTVSI